MNVLITGAAGFLGSHLMLHHLNNGDAVLGMDNFCSSEPSSKHHQAIKKLCDSDKICGQLAFCDITQKIDVLRTITDFEKKKNKNHDIKFDIMYNFACPASPPKYQSIPILTMMTCVVGTENVLNLARSHEAIVVHASTSEVYGDPDRSPQDESYRGCVNPYGPRACYDEGKRAAEALCYDYLNDFNVDVRLVRIFNTYGPHMDANDGRVVSNFIRQAIFNEEMTIYGSGNQTRSFCYVDDLIDGILSMGALSMNPKTPVNLGNPNEFTILELADLISKRLGHVKFTSQFSLPIDDPKQRCPDISLAKSLLKWEPRVQLSEGIDKTIDFFQKSII